MMKRCPKLRRMRGGIGEQEECRSLGEVFAESVV